MISYHTILRTHLKNHENYFSLIIKISYYKLFVLEQHTIQLSRPKQTLYWFQYFRLINNTKIILICIIMIGT